MAGMWLDRFTAPSATTPTGSLTPSRPYSPAPPRKNSNLAPPQRHGLGLSGPARSSTSSLDLSANTSTASLVQPPRVVNGSSLRFEQRPPSDVEDPLKLLRRILGQSGHGSEEDNIKHKNPREVDVDFGGLSLEEFLQQEPPQRPQPLKSLSEASARESRQKYQDFHNSIAECDQVLNSVEGYLTNFKAELGQVSAEIENLQARSIQLNAKLENRRKVEKLLGPAVEEVSLSPYTVKSIAEGPINNNFIKALNEIEARSALIEAKEKQDENVKALQDLKPLLDDLNAKAIERIRDYIVAQIKALRSPNINAQVIQQQTFLKYKDLYNFLARAHPVLAEEIGQAYVNTMKWYYSSHFSRYEHALSTLQLHVFDQYDLLGSESAPARRNVLGSSKTSAPQHDSFSLGRREDVLKSKNDSALPSYLAEDSKAAHYMETPFRNFNRALVDNICAEYAVCGELFSTSSYHQITRRVTEIFESTFTMGHSLTKRLVENANDCQGILLCVRLNQHFAFELQRRKVPVADSYINYTNILLWPRFQMIMDAHCESLKKVPVGTARGAAAAFSLVGAGSNESSKTSVAPHSVTQRFGQFLHGILTLSADAGDDEPISKSLGRLRSEYEILLGKLAKGVGGDAAKRNKFLYNNYSLVLTIVSDTKGKLAEDLKDHFGNVVRELKAR
ncbi:hypothetical protein LTR84_008679 [Exophiala bonariae]|uniref:Vps52/Sac2 family protein n=1 Tax=Exophiala bonariae TaxID=1690606 RepID=A0AAV9MWF3_9EURO|nr:hypothetical protein LTR84_008679 [Exophiala bonariae]